jgi:hypothetical protein
MSFGTGAAEKFEIGTRKLPEGFWCQVHAIGEAPVELTKLRRWNERKRQGYRVEMNKNRG